MSEGGGRLPLRPLPAATSDRLAELGGAPINLYRTLANQAPLLDAWIEYAWALRGRCNTRRTLRELVILRVAQLAGAGYESTQHARMARAAGVREVQIEHLGSWREHEEYDASERAALAYAEGVVAGTVTDADFAALQGAFSDAEVVELTLTASTYAGLAALLKALQIPDDEG